MKNIIRIIVCLLLIWETAFSYAAFKIPEYPHDYVNDYADLLNASQEKNLNAILKNYDIKTANQIFVGIFNSLGGENLEDLSIRIAEKWKAGAEGKDNGVLLLIFVKDRKMRIEVGYGLESTLTDVLAKAVITNDISAYFKSENYYAGIKNGITQMIKIISQEIDPEQLDRYAGKAKNKKDYPIGALVFLVIIIFLFVRHPFLRLLLFSGRGYSSGQRYSGRYGGGFSRGRGGSFGGGGSSGGW